MDKLAVDGNVKRKPVPDRSVCGSEWFKILKFGTFASMEGESKRSGLKGVKLSDDDCRLESEGKRDSFRSPPLSRVVMVPLKFMKLAIL